MCSEYGLLATLTVCTERTIRQLLLTVLNSATVLDMTALQNSPNGFFCQMLRIPGLGFLLSAVVMRTGCNRVDSGIS